MTSIVPYFTTLNAYVDYIIHHEPKKLRPARCPNCGKSGLRCHGRYHRKADRENHREDSLNPVPILRFYCPCCRRTCSVLPECIPPRRWYLWPLQQVVLLLITLEHSWRYIERRVAPVRSTIKRWNYRFQEMFTLHAFHLRSRFPNLGRNAGTFNLFWKVCLEQMSLSQAMYLVHSAGEVVP